MPRKDIHRDGKKTQFSKENQPSPEKKGPKGPRMKTILKKYLSEIIDGSELPAQDEVVLALIKKAISGDVSAAKEIFDRMDGRVTQPFSNETKKEELTDEELNDLITQKLNKKSKD